MAVDAWGWGTSLPLLLYTVHIIVWILYSVQENPSMSGVDTVPVPVPSGVDYWYLYVVPPVVEGS